MTRMESIQLGLLLYAQTLTDDPGPLLVGVGCSRNRCSGVSPSQVDGLEEAYQHTADLTFSKRREWPDLDEFHLGPAI